MAGRFRFTPKCCCGQEECIPPCIPDCQEIFRGHQSWRGHLRDTPPTSAQLDNNCVLIDERDSYNTFGSNCKYFYVENKAANQTVSVNSGNHLLGILVYALSPAKRPLCPYINTDTGERVELYGDIFDETNRSHVQILGGLNAIQPEYWNHPVSSLDTEPVNWIPTMSYDGLTHCVGNTDRWGLMWIRVFCLPFDIQKDPFRFCDDTTPVYLDPDLTYEERFYPLCVIGRTCTDGRTYSCGFDYISECGASLSNEDRGLKNASNVYSFITGSVTTSQDPVVDYYKVRLIGFAPPVGGWPIQNPTSFWIDSVAACVFFFSFTKNKSDTVTPCVIGDIFVGGISPETVTNSDYNSDYDKASTVDYSEIMLDLISDVPVFSLSPHYTIGYSPEFFSDASWGSLAAEYITIPFVNCSPPTGEIRNAKIIFGSSNSSAFEGTDSVGTSSTIPNRWKSPRLNMKTGDDSNDLNERFFGVYWLGAEYAPCNEDFKNYITHGVLWNVPIAKIEIPSSGWDISTYNMGQFSAWAWFVGLQNISYANSWGYSDLHKPLLAKGDCSQTSYIDEYYADVDPIGHAQKLRTPYLAKPTGKILRRLMWRTFLPDMYILGKNTDSTAMQSSCKSIMTWVGIPKNPGQGWISNAYEIINSGWNDPQNNQQSYYGMFYPYNVNGVMLDTTSYFDSQRAIQTYGLNKFERSVNGDGFHQLYNDNNELLYMPSFDGDSFSRLFGVQSASSLRWGGHAIPISINAFGGSSPSSSACEYSSMWIIPRVNIGYIAVWEDE